MEPAGRCNVAIGIVMTTQTASAVLCMVDVRVISPSPAFHPRRDGAYGTLFAIRDGTGHIGHAVIDCSVC